MQKIKIVLIGIVILAVIGVGYSFTQTKSGSVSDPTIVKVGVLGPLSGQYGVFGENVVKGIEVAKLAYEKSHPGTKISLVIEDDGFEAKRGLSVYKKMTSIDQVDALINVSTPTMGAIYSDASKTGMPIMQVGLQEGNIVPDNIFQTSADPAASFPPFAQYVDKHFAFDSLAVVYENSSVHTAFFKAFSENYTRAHKDFVVDGGQKSELRGHVAKILASKPQGIVFLVNVETGAILVKEMKRLGKTIPVLIFDAQLQTGWDSYVRIVGSGKEMNGAYSMWFKGGDRSTFTKEFKEKYETEPGILADFGYDTFKTLIENHDNNKSKWISNIQSSRGIGASGTISFDKNGVRLQDIEINIVKDGKITLFDGQVEQ